MKIFLIAIIGFMCSTYTMEYSENSPKNKKEIASLKQLCAQFVLDSLYLFNQIPEKLPVELQHFVTNSLKYQALRSMPLSHMGQDKNISFLSGKHVSAIDPQANLCAVRTPLRDEYRNYDYGYCLGNYEDGEYSKSIVTSSLVVDFIDFIKNYFLVCDVQAHTNIRRIRCFSCPDFEELFSLENLHFKVDKLDITRNGSKLFVLTDVGKLMIFDTKNQCIEKEFPEFLISQFKLSDDATLAIAHVDQKKQMTLTVFDKDFDTEAPLDFPQLHGDIIEIFWHPLNKSIVLKLGTSYETYFKIIHTETCQNKIFFRKNAPAMIGHVSWNEDGTLCALSDYFPSQYSFIWIMDGKVYKPILSISLDHKSEPLFLNFSESKTLLFLTQRMQQSTISLHEVFAFLQDGISHYCAWILRKIVLDESEKQYDLSEQEWEFIDTLPQPISALLHQIKEEQLSKSLKQCTIEN